MGVGTPIRIQQGLQERLRRWHHLTMPHRSSKPEEDVMENNRNSLIVAESTGTPPLKSPEPEPEAAIRAAAAALGRRGGIKGGPARARALSAKRRKAIAKAAAIARWSQKKPAAN